MWWQWSMKTEVTPGEFPFLNSVILHGWTSSLFLNIQLLSDLKTLPSVEGDLLRVSRLPLQVWHPCYSPPGNQRKRHTRVAYRHWGAGASWPGFSLHLSCLSLRCHGFWRSGAPLVCGPVSCAELAALHILDTEKSDIWVECPWKIKVYLFIYFDRWNSTFLGVTPFILEDNPRVSRILKLSP